MDKIPRTAELHAAGHRKTGTVFERARVVDALVDADAHLLLAVRVVREHLFRECDRHREDDLAVVEFVFDPVDLHVLPLEVEQLVRVEVAIGVVPKLGLLV